MSRLSNPLATISFVVLFGSAALIAQTPVTPESDLNPISIQPQTYVVPAPATAECPVSMRAQHGSGGGLMMTRNPKSSLYAQPNPDGRPGGEERSGLEQRIHLILGKVDKVKDSGRVAAAKVTVRGMNGKGLAMPASSLQFGSSNSGSSNAIKTIDVKFGVTADQTEFADLVLPGFSSVQSITLNSLTYADGSTWSSFNGNACRVAPEPFMLVSAR